MENDNDITFTFTPFVPSAEDSAGALTPSSSFGAITNTLRRSSRSLRNRLHSIAHDATFVERVRVAYDLPVLTNARAGDWYVDPQRRQGGVYFKSTDGHAGEWMFSLRRLNLGLLEVVVEGGRGAIIVDSTRRGKRFPDSLSKTIPIWIAVMNAIAFPNMPLALQTLPQAVSPTEANSITQKLPGFVADFLALGLDLTPVRRLQKPLRPLWLTPASPLPDTPPSFTEFTPLVLVTASRMVKGAGIEGEYIQGAGDDHEGWAQESGLTPALFWRHHEKLLAARDDDELAELVGTICGDHRAGTGEDAAQQGGCTLVRPTEGVYVNAAGSGSGLYDVVVNCCAATPLDHVAEAGCTVVPFPVPAGKKGIKALRAGLSGVVRAVEVGGGVGPGRRVAVVCESGDEVAPVVALVLLCLFYDDEGRFRRMEGEERARVVDKAYIRRRLAWIAASRPSANPARGALNVVNSFLMERPA